MYCTGMVCLQMSQQIGRVTVPGQYSPTTTTAHNATVIDGPPFHSTLQTKVLPHDALRANLGYKFRIRHVQRYAIAIPTNAAAAVDQLACVKLY